MYLPNPNYSHILYFSNKIFHSLCEVGGNDPVIFHSTIDRPECVNLVSPPTTTIKNIKKQPLKSQITMVLFSLFNFKNLFSFY